MNETPEREGVSETAVSAAIVEPMPVMAAVPKSAEFKRKSVRGGAAAILAQVAGMVLQIGTTFILARLLAPSDYGLQAMVITLTAFVSLFKDAGLSVASVQRDTLTHEQISTLFWINIGLGIVLMIAAAAMAPVLAAFYKEPRLFWLTIASSTIFFFNSLAIQHRALLDRSMRFGTSAKIDTLCAVVGTAVAITLAILKFGYWALICQNIALPVVGAIAVWIAMPWRPGRPRWSAEMRSMVRFGGTVTLNGVVVYIAYNTEKILLGRYWGAAPLGIYGRAFQLATLPVQQLINAVHSVAFFGAVADAERSGALAPRVSEVAGVDRFLDRPSSHQFGVVFRGDRPGRARPEVGRLRPGPAFARSHRHVPCLGQSLFVVPARHWQSGSKLENGVSHLPGGNPGNPRWAAQRTCRGGDGIFDRHGDPVCANRRLGHTWNRNHSARLF